MVIKHTKDVNSSEEFTPNNSVKNQVQDTNFTRNSINKTLKISLNSVISLITELLSVKKDLCINTIHFHSFTKVNNLLLKLHSFLNIEFKPKTLDFAELIAYSKFIDQNVSGTRITMNILPRIKGENIILEYYKNQFYKDVVIKTFYALEKELQLFKRLHISNTHKRRIINNLLSETQELKDYIKNANILHLLYYKRELIKLNLKNSNIKSIICYYYWTEKTNYLTENNIDLWIN